MSKNCKTCNFCNPLYQRIEYKYWLSRRYICTLSGELTVLSNTCDNWRKKEKAYCDLSPERFEKFEQDIKTLKELLTDKSKKENCSITVDDKD